MNDKSQVSACSNVFEVRWDLFYSLTIISLQIYCRVWWFPSLGQSIYNTIRISSILCQTFEKKCGAVVVDYTASSTHRLFSTAVPMLCVTLLLCRPYAYFCTGCGACACDTVCVMHVYGRNRFVIRSECCRRITGAKTSYLFIVTTAKHHIIDDGFSSTLVDTTTDPAFIYSRRVCKYHVRIYSVITATGAWFFIFKSPAEWIY